MSGIVHLEAHADVLNEEEAAQARTLLAALAIRQPPPPVPDDVADQCRKSMALATWFAFAINELREAGPLHMETVCAALASALGTGLAGMPFVEKAARLQKFCNAALSAAAALEAGAKGDAP